MSDLHDLAVRAEQAMGPSYALDCEIWDAIYPGERDERFEKVNASYGGRLGPADKDGYVKPLRAFTASLDAALTLVPHSWRWVIGNAGFAAVEPPSDDPGEPEPGTAQICGATPALALTAAALRARSTMEKHETGEEVAR